MSDKKCKIGKVYYSFAYLKNIADDMGYNPNGKALYFLSDNFYVNIFNPVLLFDTKNSKWNIDYLVSIKNNL